MSSRPRTKHRGIKAKVCSRYASSSFLPPPDLAHARMWNTHGLWEKSARLKFGGVKSTKDCSHVGAPGSRPAVVGEEALASYCHLILPVVLAVDAFMKSSCPILDAKLCIEMQCHPCDVAEAVVVCVLLPRHTTHEDITVGSSWPYKDNRQIAGHEAGIIYHPAEIVPQDIMQASLPQVWDDMYPPHLISAIPPLFSGNS